MSALEIGDAISISKGSVSTGTRQLLALGCIRKVWLQEELRTMDDGTLLVAKQQETDGITPVPPGARVALDWPAGQMRAFADGVALQ